MTVEGDKPLITIICDDKRFPEHFPESAARLLEASVRMMEASARKIEASARKTEASARKMEASARRKDRIVNGIFATVAMLGFSVVIGWFFGGREVAMAALKRN